MENKTKPVFIDKNLLSRLRVHSYERSAKLGRRVTIREVVEEMIVAYLDNLN